MCFLFVKINKIGDIYIYIHTRVCVCVCIYIYIYQFSSVQLLSHVQLFVNPWMSACQASLSITNSQSLLKLMAIQSVMPSNHLLLCHSLFLLPSIFPTPESFPRSHFFPSGGQIIGVSPSASFLPMNIQD